MQQGEKRSLRTALPQLLPMLRGFNLVNQLWWLGLTAKEQRPTGKVERLQAEWFARQAGIYEKWRQVGEDHTKLLLTPRKVDVQVTAFGLAWVPFAQGVAAYGAGGYNPYMVAGGLPYGGGGNFGAFSQDGIDRWA